MFERIKEFFYLGTYETPMPENDVPHALGALMVRIAKSDKAYLFEEIEEIDHLLAEQFNLNPVQAAKMRAECEVLEETLPEDDAFLAVLHNTIAPDRREELLVALWQVVLADNERHQAEDAHIAQARRFFGISEKRSIELLDVAYSKQTEV